jgi:hypothetical protein
LGFDFPPAVPSARLLLRMQIKSQASSANSATLPTVAPTIAPVRALPVRPPLLAAVVVGEWVGEVAEVVVMGFDVMVECEIDADPDAPFVETVRMVVRVL